MKNKIPASVAGDAEPLRHTLRAILYGGVIATLFGGAGGVWAGELGHYGPGVPNIRDFFVPELGFYYSIPLPLQHRHPQGPQRQ